MSTHEAFVWLTRHDCTLSTEVGVKFTLIYTPVIDGVRVGVLLSEPYGDPGVSVIKLVQSAIAWEAKVREGGNGQS